MAIKSKICSVPECNNQRDFKQRSSLCLMHRMRRSRFKSFNHPNNPNEFKSSYEELDIKYDSKATGKMCCVTNCPTRVWGHGTICSKHRWRKKKYGSYDLPDHIGKPNEPIIISFPDGIVYNCKIHGHLQIQDTYQKKYNDNIHYKCKTCMLNKNIKRKYQGMNDLNDYDRMLSGQNHCCAICKGQNTTTRNGVIKRFAIDHDHSNQKVRGLLCAFCNALIGYAKDNIETLQSAIDYLKSHK